MRIVIQRVSKASVVVDGQTVGNINKGIMALVGFSKADDDKTMDYMLDKLVNLRIFEDNEEKMNLSIKDVNGELLIVPNFTLYGDCRKGRRPSYSTSASVEEALQLFDRFVKKAKESGVHIETGIFQAHMEVTLTNDGPVTLLLDSDRQF